MAKPSKRSPRSSRALAVRLLDPRTGRLECSRCGERWFSKKGAMKCPSCNRTPLVEGEREETTP